MVVPSAVAQLGKGIAVVQLFIADIGVIPHDARQLAVVVVIIDLALKHTSGSGFPCQCSFAVCRVHATVGAVLFFCGHTVAQDEGIIVFGIQIFAGKRNGQSAVDALRVTQVRTGISE